MLLSSGDTPEIRPWPIFFFGLPTCRLRNSFSSLNDYLRVLKRYPWARHLTSNSYTENARWLWTQHCGSEGLHLLFLWKKNCTINRNKNTRAHVISWKNKLQIGAIMHNLQSWLIVLRLNEKSVLDSTISISQKLQTFVWLSDSLAILCQSGAVPKQLILMIDRW